MKSPAQEQMLIDASHYTGEDGTRYYFDMCAPIYPANAPQAPMWVSVLVAAICVVIAWALS